MIVIRATINLQELRKKHYKNSKHLCSSRGDDLTGTKDAKIVTTDTRIV
ncbi:hypothetical protein G9F73_016125 [Clostridium estertheticum]|nr:hypothetical protein [Clostridium estertheticum]MBZ9609320.1 hypothetical protein [Clostridium estertheticum]